MNPTPSDPSDKPPPTSADELVWAADKALQDAQSYHLLSQSMQTVSGREKEAKDYERKTRALILCSAIIRRHAASITENQS